MLKYKLGAFKASLILRNVDGSIINQLVLLYLYNIYGFKK